MRSSCCCTRPWSCCCRGRQRHIRAADGAPPPRSCLTCTRWSRLCHPLVRIVPDVGRRRCTLIPRYSTPHGRFSRCQTVFEGVYHLYPVSETMDGLPSGLSCANCPPLPNPTASCSSSSWLLGVRSSERVPPPAYSSPADAGDDRCCPVMSVFLFY